MRGGDYWRHIKETFTPHLGAINLEGIDLTKAYIE